MRLRRSCLVGLSVLACVSCTDVPAREPRPKQVQAMTDRRLVTVMGSENMLTQVRDRRQNERRETLAFLVAVTEYVETAARARGASRAAGSAGPVLTSPHRPAVSTTPPTGLEPCGADDGLPPCEVKRRESGGSYTAYNPTGCGGAGCFGAWQFSGEWAGKLGLPLDLATATPEQQDNAARELWNGGRGCSNWAAC